MYYQFFFGVSWGDCFAVLKPFPSFTGNCNGMKDHMCYKLCIYISLSKGYCHFKKSSIPLLLPYYLIKQWSKWLLLPYLSQNLLLSLIPSVYRYSVAYASIYPSMKHLLPCWDVLWFAANPTLP